ncbi:MAG TPA: hypothetical protein VFB16_12220 [Bauldia sp.]|nr:hypothetical protein [Bauldia sp.]
MIRRFGFVAALAACIASIAYDIPQVLQAAGVLVPPWDGILIFAPSLALAPCFALAMAGLHAATAGERRVWSLAALTLGTIYATLVSIVYITQLTVVIPHAIAGDTAYQFLACCGTHEFLTGVDLLGYTVMGLATLCAGLALAPAGAPPAARWWLFANAALTPFIFLQVAWPQLIWIAAAWIVTFPAAMAYLAIAFRRGAAAFGDPLDASPIPGRAS